VQMCEFEKGGLGPTCSLGYSDDQLMLLSVLIQVDTEQFFS